MICAAPDIQVDAVQDLDLAVAGVQAADGQQGVCQSSTWPSLGAPAVPPWRAPSHQAVLVGGVSASDGGLLGKDGSVPPGVAAATAAAAGLGGRLLGGPAEPSRVVLAGVGGEEAVGIAGQRSRRRGRTG